ncbi:enolase-like [Silene latifolia]|uniref:enolase-like n=1 Tax=Silene latifolia TaxID=37657 RepID=UPI003D776F96
MDKDPTQQTEIDNFMVQQLDGTVNEWGWCKQKCELQSVIKKKYGQDATNVVLNTVFILCFRPFRRKRKVLSCSRQLLRRLDTPTRWLLGWMFFASEFYKEDKSYDLNFKEENNDGSQRISGEPLKDLYKSFVAEYPIVSIEYPFDQDDWEHYANMTAEIGDNIQIVGDDLLMTAEIGLS